MSGLILSVLMVVDPFGNLNGLDLCDDGYFRIDWQMARRRMDTFLLRARQTVASRTVEDWHLPPVPGVDSVTSKA